MKKMTTNYGYKEPKRSYKDHKFGGITALKGQPLTDGHWLKYLVPAENQDTAGPTFSCTSFGTLNCLEILFKFLGQDKNFSDRFSAITSETNPQSGNDPVKVIDTARLIGLIPESELPYDSTINSVDKFYSPRPMTQNYLDMGEQFLNQYGMGYDDVYPTPDTLKQALCYSPLGVSVKAWFPRGDKFYFPDGLPYNHWTALVDYEDGNYWLIFDSYENNLKKIEWNSVFSKVLRYQIGKPSDFQLTIIERILRAMNVVVFLIQKWYNTTKMDNQNKPIVPDQTIPPMTPPVSKIQIWAKAIQVQEGWSPISRSYKNNNPGNLKFTTYTQSLGAIGKDSGNFCIFPNYDVGFGALCHFLIDAAQNDLKDYHNATILSFTKTYAQPPNDNYAKAVAAALNVDVNTPIKNLL